MSLDTKTQGRRFVDAFIDAVGCPSCVIWLDRLDNRDAVEQAAERDPLACLRALHGTHLTTCGVLAMRRNLN